MQWYKWRAYDKSGAEHTGTTQSRRWEEVALKLISNGLSPSKIEKISFEEYRKYHAADVTISRLKKFRYSIGPYDELPTLKIRKSNMIAKIVTVIALIFVIAVIAAIGYFIYSSQS